MPRIKTFYDELGVPRDANAAAIKHAFKEIAKVYHPDKNPPDKQKWAHEQMARVNFIVETLLNPTTRKEYDDIVRGYEEAPVVPRARRPAREQYAIEREYGRISVEIMNLSVKYDGCRLKMAIGAAVGSFAATLHVLAYLTHIFDEFRAIFLFSFLFSLTGGGLLV